MAKKITRSIIILFFALVFLSQISIDPLLAGWIVTGDSIGEGVPVFAAKNESKDKSLTFSISYNTGEPFPAIDIGSAGDIKFKMRTDNRPDKAIIIFSSSSEYQFNAYPANERYYFLSIDRKEFDALISGFKKEKQFTLSIISEDNKNIIINKKVFDLDNAYNAVLDITGKHDSAMLDETDFIFPDSGKRILNKDETQLLSNLSKKRLQVARNEIFARHGYIFSTNDMTDHFSKKKWYKPLTTNVSLSDIEKKNIELIKAAEN